jgi:hypothetical protein
MARRTILDRAVVPRLTLSALSRLRARRFVGHRYFLRTDISQFYPSIYTHSIPWALHGKTAAKANKGNTQGDKIDKALRQQQEGQTVGIPIGPDCSLIVAEVLLASVDVRLTTQRLNGLRYVDDYELGFRTLSEAEDTLTRLQSVLAEFELYLNPHKTTLTDGPAALDDGWAVGLRGFPFGSGRTARGDLNDAIGFFNKVFELSRERPDQAIIRYGVVVAKRWRFTGPGWRTYQSLLLNAATADPSALPVIIVILSTHVAAGQPIEASTARKVVEAIIARHAPLSHGSEVAWALWAAIQFNLAMSSQAAAIVGRMEDDVVALLALDANDRGLFPKGAHDTSFRQNIANVPDALDSDHWLLSYESHRKGWLQCPAVARHGFFQILERNAISFYDPGLSLTQFKGPAAAAPGGTLAVGYE